MSKEKKQNISFLSVLYRWRSAAFMIGAVAIDSLLTWKVYLYSDEIAFFIFGLSFTIIPLTILSIGLCCQKRQQSASQNNRFHGIPLLNVLWILSLDNNKTKIMQIALSVLMSLPQYLLNDTFILSQRHLTMYNKLQLLASYVVIMFSPLLNFSLIMFDEMKQEQIKNEFHSSDTEMSDVGPIKANKLKKKRRKRAKNSFYSDAKLYCKVLLSASIVLPLIFIELIHFFPVLLEYCYYSHIGLTDLMGNMILFNIPKFPIAALTIWIAMDHNERNLRKRRNDWCGWHFWMLCGLFLWSCITPLIVAITVIKSEYNAHKSMLCLAIAYIILSYGGMCAWLLLSVEPKYFGLGMYTKYCIVIILVLILINIVILLTTDWYEYYRKGAKSKFIALPLDIEDDDDENVNALDDEQENIKLVDKLPA